jgi:hypothetical protein
MTVKELREALAKFDDDMIVLATNDEGYYEEACSPRAYAYTKRGYIFSILDEDNCEADLTKYPHAVII